MKTTLRLKRERKRLMGKRNTINKITSTDTISNTNTCGLLQKGSYHIQMRRGCYKAVRLIIGSWFPTGLKVRVTDMFVLSPSGTISTLYSNIYSKYTCVTKLQKQEYRRRKLEVRSVKSFVMKMKFLRNSLLIFTTSVALRVHKKTHVLY